MQVAVIAGNLELAEMIQNYKPEDIGKCSLHVFVFYVIFLLNAQQICYINGWLVSLRYFVELFFPFWY